MHVLMLSLEETEKLKKKERKKEGRKEGRKEVDLEPRRI
jgi:hypothetical protein